MRRKFRLRYVSGVQSIDPYQEELRKLDSKEDTVAQLASVGASFIPVVGQFAAPLVGAATKFVAGKVNEDKRNQIEKDSRDLGKFQEAQNSVVGDVTENQASSFKKGTAFITSEVAGVAQKGKKDIEVEKDELMFRLIGGDDKGGGKWKLIADFNGGKTHEAGGEDITAQQGDVIFPGTKRSKLIKLLDSNGFVSRENTPQFETEKFKLPKDTNKEKAKEGLEVNKGLEIANTVGTALPTTFNIVKGLGKAQKETRRFVQPKEAKFIDTSQVAKNEAREQFQVDTENITRVAGGNAGTVLSNVGAAGNRLQRKFSEINAGTAAGGQAVENQNVERRNRAEFINTQLAVGFDEKDAANRAAKDTFLGEGLSQIGDITQQNLINANLKERDKRVQNVEATKLSILGNTSNFRNPNTPQDYLDAFKSGNLSGLKPPEFIGATLKDPVLKKNPVGPPNSGSSFLEGEEFDPLKEEAGVDFGKEFRKGTRSLNMFI